MAEASTPVTPGPGGRRPGAPGAPGTRLERRHAGRNAPTRHPSKRRATGRVLALVGALDLAIALFLPWILQVSFGGGSSGINAFALGRESGRDLLRMCDAEWVAAAIWMLPMIAGLCAGLVLADRFVNLKKAPAVAVTLGGLAVLGFSLYVFLQVPVLRQLGAVVSMVGGGLLLAASWGLWLSKWSPPPARPENSPAAGRRQVPWVTVSIAALNVLAFLALAWRSDYDHVVRELGLIGGSVLAHALLTHMFLHGDLLHLLTNMAVLLAVGWVLERRVGRARFILIYLLGGLAGAAGDIFLDPRTFVPGIGASGAVASVIGLCIAVAPWARVRVWFFALVTAGWVSLPAAWLFSVWVALQAIGTLRLAAGLSDGVGYWSHLGGLVFGLAAGLALRAMGKVAPEPQPERPEGAAGDGAAGPVAAKLQARGRVRAALAPYVMIAIALAISLGAAVLTLTSGTLLGSLAGFQRDWNSGRLERVEARFDPARRESLVRQFRQLMKDTEANEAEGRTDYRIALIGASLRDKGRTCVARFHCAPRGRDPFRSEGRDVGRMEVWLEKHGDAWRIGAMSIRGMDRKTGEPPDGTTPSPAQRPEAGGS